MHTGHIVHLCLCPQRPAHCSAHSCMALNRAGRPEKLRAGRRGGGVLQEPGEGIGAGTVAPQTHTQAGVTLVLRLRGKLAMPSLSTPPGDNGESPWGRAGRTFLRREGREGRASSGLREQTAPDSVSATPLTAQQPRASLSPARS